MISWPRNTSADGASRRQDLLRSILRFVDTRSAGYWSFADVQEWEPGDFAWLQELGLVREGAPAQEICPRDCISEEVFEPCFRTHAVTGERIALCHCGECGDTHTVRPEDMRTWRSTFAQAAGFLATAAGGGEVQVLMPEHVARIGSVKQQEGEAELLLVRGFSWRRGLVSECTRLRDARSAVVVSLGSIPDARDWGAGWHQVLAAHEHLSLVNETPRLTVPILLPPTRAAAKPVLTPQERDVLEALAETPQEPMLISVLAGRSGYGRDLVMTAVRTLEKHGLVSRPEGRQRKGVSIAAAGLALVNGNML